MGRNIDSATFAVLLGLTAVLLSFMKSIAIKARYQVEFWREAVWSAVYLVLAEPEHLIAAQEQEYSGDTNDQMIRQAEFLQEEIDEANEEDEKLYKAHMSDVFDKHEYAVRRKLLKQSQQNLVQEHNKIQSNLMSSEELEDRKRMILAMSERTVQSGLGKVVIYCQ